MRVTKRLTAALALLGLTGFLAGCGDEEVVTVTEDPAVVLNVTAAPTSLKSGAAAQVIVEVVKPTTGDFTFAWQATGGRFSSTTRDTTTWYAPDVAGQYTVSVTATDGQNAAVGTATLAVDTYLPTVTPYYKGAEACALCHNGGSGGSEYGTWKNSAHAGALGSLQAIGMGNNAACIPCHTVGYNGVGANAALNNGGYDEQAVPRLAGVQCENCHGPGSEHPTNDPTSVKLNVDASLCGSCHQDAHHPTYEEWQESGHSQVIAAEAVNRSCAKCHNGIESIKYLDDPANYVAPAAGWVAPDTLEVTCAVCHDPHGNSNPGSLRNASVTDVVLPNGILVPQAGAGRLCMSCHNGRRTDTDIQGQIDNGGRLGPHHSVQGDMITGVNAYEDVNPTFSWASSKHILVQDACVTCHTHPHEGDPESGIANFMGHTFEPTVQACEPCHGTLESFDAIQAKEDYDGDGTIEGVQDEVSGLMAELEQTIINASATPEARALLEADFDTNIPKKDVSTPDQRAAGYNLYYVEYDASRGVHNRTYAVQLLQQSILFLNPTALQSAYILTRDE